MQVIANIHTGNRTVFQYLFQPFIDSMDDAMGNVRLIFKCFSNVSGSPTGIFPTGISEFATFYF